MRGRQPRDVAGRGLVLLLLGALWLGVAGCGDQRHPAAGPFEQVARRTIEAIRDRDFATLGRLAHPELGVRFSPYAYVRPQSDVVLTGAELAAGASDPRVRTWGVRDGSGEPIRGNLADYWESFVYDVDFAAADEVAWDRRLGHGNSIDNRDRVYPGTRTVEYHFRGFDPELDGLDWRSLRLVFASHDDRWYLVAIIHDQWTI